MEFPLSEADTKPCERAERPLSIEAAPQSPSSIDCFQKMSKRDIATPKEEMDIVHARLAVAAAMVKGMRK